LFFFIILKEPKMSQELVVLHGTDQHGQTDIVDAMTKTAKKLKRRGLKVVAATTGDYIGSSHGVDDGQPNKFEDKIRQETVNLHQNSPLSKRVQEIISAAGEVTSIEDIPEDNRAELMQAQQTLMAEGNKIVEKFSTQEYQRVAKHYKALSAVCDDHVGVLGNHDLITGYNPLKEAGVKFLEKKSHHTVGKYIFKGHNNTFEIPHKFSASGQASNQDPVTMAYAPHMINYDAGREAGDDPRLKKLHDAEIARLNQGPKATIAIMHKGVVPGFQGGHGDSAKHLDNEVRFVHSGHGHKAFIKKVGGTVYFNPGPNDYFETHYASPTKIKKVVVHEYPPQNATAANDNAYSQAA